MSDYSTKDDGVMIIDKFIEVTLPANRPIAIVPLDRYKKLIAVAEAAKNLFETSENQAAILWMNELRNLVWELEK